MKKVFEAPVMSIEKFSAADIITTSGYTTSSYETKVRNELSSKGVSDGNLLEKTYNEIVGN